MGFDLIWLERFGGCGRFDGQFGEEGEALGCDFRGAYLPFLFQDNFLRAYLDFRVWLSGSEPEVSSLPHTLCSFLTSFLKR